MLTKGRGVAFIDYGLSRFRVRPLLLLLLGLHRHRTHNPYQEQGAKNRIHQSQTHQEQKGTLNLTLNWNSHVLCSLHRWKVGWSTSWHHRLGISPGTGISASDTRAPSLSADTIEPVVDDSLDSGDAVSDRERVLGDVLSSRDSLSGSGEFLAVLVYDGMAILTMLLFLLMELLFLGKECNEGGALGHPPTLTIKAATLYGSCSRKTRRKEFTGLSARAKPGRLELTLMIPPGLIRRLFLPTLGQLP